MLMTKSACKSACATIALMALGNIVSVNSALAGPCASAAEAAALKTAVLQQELMVAAFQCHESGAYNQFVMSYRGELQSSDATLKAFFVRRGGEHGEAGYDSFKTKAANLSALEQARNSRAFCADAHGLYAAALHNQGSLASFVESRSSATDLGGICAESRPVLATAPQSTIRPVARPVLAAAGSPAKPLVKIADAGPVAVTPVAVTGVPAHSAPVNPYRSEEAAATSPPDAPDEYVQGPREMERSDAADADQGDAPPPPRPRAYQAREQEDYDSAEEDSDSAPAPRWRDYPPPPRYGWYPQYDYRQW